MHGDRIFTMCLLIETRTFPAMMGLVPPQHPHTTLRTGFPCYYGIKEIKQEIDSEVVAYNTKLRSIFFKLITPQEIKFQLHLRAVIKIKLKDKRFPRKLKDQISL